MKLFVTEEELERILETIDEIAPSEAIGLEPSEKDVKNLIGRIETCENDTKSLSQKKDFKKYLVLLCWISENGEKSLSKSTRTEIRDFIDSRIKHYKYA